MKTLLTLLAGLLLAGGSVAHAIVQEPVPQAKTTEGCDTESQDSGQVLGEGQEVLPLSAIITKIDYTKGLLDLDTEVGSFQVSAAPAEIQDLKEGDEILVYVIEDEESEMTPVAL